MDTQQYIETRSRLLILTVIEAADMNDWLSHGELGEVETPVAMRHNRKAGICRNDPCPCGSGKKFKRCCIRRQ